MNINLFTQLISEGFEPGASWLVSRCAYHYTKRCTRNEKGTNDEILHEIFLACQILKPRKNLPRVDS